MRFQLALNVDDLEQAVPWYGRLLGVPVLKREAGYASFVVERPPLKLVLFEAPGAERLNHVGFEAFDDETVASAAERLAAAGLHAEHRSQDTCCYARQHKTVAHDPQGLMWEWYRVLEDVGTFDGTPPGEDAPPSGTRGPGDAGKTRSGEVRAPGGCC